MYNIGICDDGKHICASIENMILHYAEDRKIQVDTKVWYTGEKLKDYLAQGNHLDILFLDIELFKMTGIEIGNYIRNHLDNAGMQIVYISGKAYYMQYLFKTQPVDFLLKPISQSQIDATLDMAIHIVKKKNERFEFQQGKDYYYIPMGEIIYFCSERRRVTAVCEGKKYSFYGKLGEIQRLLAERNNHFLRIHQSYLVNTKYVKEYHYNKVILHSGEALRVSRDNRKSIREIHMLLMEN